MPDRSLEQLRVGQQIGNYRLVRRLGQGGFAEVYLGQHLHLPVQAAIKLLLGAFDSPADNKKFRAEAQIVASLRHPHIVHILDFGIEPASQLPYLIMDYAPNGSLRQRHPRGTILPPATILSYLRQIASALDFAHRHNIVHRDVKPENMLLTDWDLGELDGRGTGSSLPASDNDTSPKILLSDFGIAVLTARNPEISLASVPGLAGTPAYMAPEQLRGKPVAASDQYSLAVVVYEWLCGQHPFRGTFPQVANQHINAFPPLPSERNPRISSALEDVVLTALSKAPSRRYPSVSDFANAFATAIQPPRRPSPIATSPSSLASTIPPRAMRQLPSPDPLSQKSDPPTQPALPHEPAIKPAESRPPTRRALLLTLSGLVVAGGISGGVLWFEDGLRSGQAGTGRITTSATGKNGSSLGKTRHIYHASNFVNAVAWSPNGPYLASGNDNNTVQVWDTRIASFTSNPIFTYTKHSARVNALAWSPNGDLLASASDDTTIHVWKPTTGDLVQKYAGHVYPVHSVSWSPDGKSIASGSDDSTVQIWNPLTGNLITRYTGHANPVRAVAWSPNGETIASTSVGEDIVLVWDVATKNIITRYSQKGTILTLAWSPDGAYIASGGQDTTVHVWDANTSMRNSVYKGHKGTVRSIAWSINGNKIASGSEDHTVQIWSAFNPSLIYKYQNHSNWVFGLAWSQPDETLIASGSYDKTVQVWQAV